MNGLFGLCVIQIQNYWSCVFFNTQLPQNNEKMSKSYKQTLWPLKWPLLPLLTFMTFVGLLGDSWYALRPMETYQTDEKSISLIWLFFQTAIMLSKPFFDLFSSMILQSLQIDWGMPHLLELITRYVQGVRPKCSSLGRQITPLKSENFGKCQKQHSTFFDLKNWWFWFCEDN